MQSSQFNFKSLRAKWPSTIVARKEFDRFSGGLVSPGTLANADSEGTGPEGRFLFGNKVAYPIDSAIEWLEKRARAADEAQNPFEAKKARRKRSR